MCLLTSSRTSSNEGKEEVNRVGLFLRPKLFLGIECPSSPNGKQDSSES